MTALYYPPKFDSGLPGAKLWFYQTNTTTPQNTYTDEALAVASSNPVVADADGVFEPIYLDPTLPNYRVKYTDSADVLLYQVDDVPSNQGVQQSMRLEATNPFLFLYDTDGSVNQRKYRLRVAGDTFYIEAINDAESSATTLLSANSGVLTLQTNARINGDSIAVTESGTFTATLTGCTTSPTGTVRYTQVGNVVILHIPAISGTSNSTAMTLTGLPGALQVGASTTIGLVRVTDNGTTSLGVASISAPGSTITFGLGVDNSAFTSSGTKGVASTIFTYQQN